MTDEYDPLTGELLPKSTAPNVVITEATDVVPDLSSLESMTKEGLIALVQRMSRQCGMVACMTKEETVQAMLDKLAHTALKDTAPIQSSLVAIEKWLDREKGKPMQMQQSLIAVANTSETTFISILGQIDGRSTGLPEIDAVFS